MKRKRSKKHNPIEAERRYNMQVLKNTAVAFITNDMRDIEPVKFVTLTGDELNVTMKIAHAISDYRYKWSVMLTVFCTEKRGKNTCKMELVEFTTPYLQSELVQYLSKRHMDFIKKWQDTGVNIIGAGWLASPIGRDFSTDEVGDIFTKLKAWD